MSESIQTTWRILDANYNRAREALRVIEEYARFCLNDGALTSTTKELRHRLGGIMQAVTATPDPGGACAQTGGPATDRFVAARDIRGDVGRTTKAKGELERRDAEHAASASCKRLSEALRAMEEYGKTVAAPLAHSLESLRYDAYELERRVVLTGRGRKRFGQVRLYVLLTAALCRADWLTTAEAALRGGADALQLREKGLPDGELMERAKRLVELCRKHSALLIVNDRPDIAAASGADGVHLGQDDLPVAAARNVSPSRCLIGLSTHTIPQMERGVEEAPDYLAVGPMFPSSTKAQDHIAGPGTLAAARERTSLPLVAVGGINAANVAEVLAAADCCICVCQAVIGAGDAAAAASSLKAVLARPSAASLST